MPLPIAHSLVGLSIRQFDETHFFKNKWQDLSFVIFLSLLPDIDFLPGFIIGKPNIYHHGISHTFICGFFISVFTALIFHVRKRSFKRVFLLTFLLYSSHLILDVFTEDKKAPFGMMLFWPFSKEYILSSISLFSKVDRAETSANFFSSIFRLKNLYSIFKEMIISLFIFTSSLLVAKVLKRISNS